MRHLLPHHSAPRRLAPVLAAALVSVCVLAPAAHADRDETRLAAGLSASQATVTAFEGRARTTLPGIGLSVHRGIRNWLDVGLSLSYAIGRDIAIEGATMDGAGGDGYTLYANLHSYQATASARTHLEAGPFLRLRPFLGAGVGVRIQNLSNAELFHRDSTFVAEGDASWSATPSVSGEVGFSYRMSDSVEGAALIRGTRSRAQEALVIAVELSWLLQ